MGSLNPKLDVYIIHCHILKIFEENGQLTINFPTQNFPTFTSSKISLESLG